MHTSTAVPKIDAPECHPSSGVSQYHTQNETGMQITSDSGT